MEVAEMREAIEIGRNCDDLVGQCFSPAADGSLGEMVRFPAPIAAAPAASNDYSGPAIKPH